ncbi:MAG: chloride channel protein [Hyphomicrobiales bacterium]
MKKRQSLLGKFLIWRIKHISDKNFLMILGIIIGFLGGVAAVIIKKSVHAISSLLTEDFALDYHNYLYFALPMIGIFIAIVYAKFIVKKHVGHGIPSVLYAIGKNNGIIKRHNILSSIVTSTFTVGFGGSVGLEGPTVATGAAIGSNIGQMLRFNYKQITLLLGLACAAAMAAIFKSPVAAVVFAIEVIMIDLTMASLVPLLFASATAVLTSYLFLGQTVVYPFEVTEGFQLKNILHFILLGILCGLVSVYFTQTYMAVERKFAKMKKWYTRLIIGGILLGVLTFLFPSLYGEGYEAVNNCLSGDTTALFHNSVFYSFQGNFYMTVLLFVLILLFKPIATSTTFGAGGVGGIFAPTLFLGAFTGLLFSFIIEHFNITDLNAANFALVGMGGLIAGVLHAPLTAIFLIAELTGGYELFVPLMITATISYATIKMFVNNSVYTHQLAKRGELITHHKDKAVLSLMKVEPLIEKNFESVNVDDFLGDLVKVIPKTSRNIFPVIDKENNFQGMIDLDSVRNIMFKPELYDNVNVRSLMIMPTVLVDPGESMEEVAKKFQTSGRYNIPVVNDGKYVGFISRANVFLSYRKMLKHFSDD